MNIAQTVGTVNRDVDVRGFSYELEPVRQKQQWRLERLMANLASAQQEVTRVEMRIDELQQLHEVQAEAISQAMRQRLDPSAHRHSLNYLSQLRERSRQMKEERQALLETCASLRAACVAQQLRIEGLMRHKEEALHEYAHEMRQRAGAEQDRDWLARISASAGRKGVAR